MEKLTQKELKRLLHYDPETGVFTWLKRPSNRVEIGQEAGYINRHLGYRIIGILGQVYFAHRLAFLYMKGKWPREIDHVNRVKSDNKWENLREVSRSENSINKDLQANNKSGHKGIHWNEDCQKWHVSITRDGRVKYVGLFESLDEAVIARRKAEMLHAA